MVKFILTLLLAVCSRFVLGQNATLTINGIVNNDRKILVKNEDIIKILITLPNSIPSSHALDKVEATACYSNPEQSMEQQASNKIFSLYNKLSKDETKYRYMVNFNNQVGNNSIEIKFKANEISPCKGVFFWIKIYENNTYTNGIKQIPGFKSTYTFMIQ
ncbi:hypothetical protein [Hymenobacter fodinae]|uniref:Uncharacterized protein n=1 Tax=Hymenobacter fodinae TaxID=2510796 RepID=A0A4Z0P203_9BACT|nr:hypothetical protein [Hymenobacter fodinae]TGE03845.1 hypothetical protein EU556_24880 [Hymenobacter fodinae]